MTKRKRTKAFLSDVVVNTIAFGIYMVAYHIIMLPWMADTLSVDDNARWLLYLMIASVIYNSLGYMLGNLYQIQIGRGQTENTVSDVNTLRIRTNLLLLVIFPVLLLLGFNVTESLFFTLTTILSNERSYLQAVLRQKRRYGAIAGGNIAYLLGSVIGLILFRFVSQQIWIPVFVAELLVVLYSLVQEKEFTLKPNKPSSEFTVTRKEYFDLTSSSLLANIPTYGDKILILPLLGSYAMSSYYAGSALSKVLMLLVNPINGVILSWLSASTGDRNKIVRRSMRLNIVLVALILIVTVPVIYIATRLLYSQFLATVIPIIIPLALDSTFAVSTTILRTIYLRYFNLGSLKYINILKIVSFALLSVIGAYLGGLVGFAYGKAISTVLIWIVYYFVMSQNTRVDAEESVDTF